MRYALYKTVRCALTTHKDVGEKVPRTGLSTTNYTTTDINKAYIDAQRYNAEPCECKVEVREVEE